ncbi:type III polyketide synthase (plasmid) [Burkholderia gladioli]|uniref:3,5-dihydroxyphenylacetyl-CoA synthase DpgA n=1 Tax=Burkholderia gladioli TaxID=28095 RepID=UPI001938038D|nr:3,5-dihydroxyphenylacetyl-CoA synthase DpgA [Burkholderia gladioli]QPQ89131.1 type III polyketide synthase [Burkholderia gladioli]
MASSVSASLFSNTGTELNVKGPFVEIVSVGTATPARSYTQVELLELFRIEDRRIRSLFLNSAIERRHLSLPHINDDGSLTVEGQGDLLRKHKSSAVEIGRNAVEACLSKLGATCADVAYLSCVTTTGFLAPSLSALLSRELGLKRDCARIDVVGMGCNAGLNALQAAANWAKANPGRLAIMLCTEICSAAYVWDGSVESAVVNSLFGDGAAAVAMIAVQGPTNMLGLRISKFASYIHTEALNGMRFDWNDSLGKFSFFLDPRVPYIVGAKAEQVVTALLNGTGLRRSRVDHWLLHSGGKKVIDAVRVNLGLTTNDVRHTTSVLRDYGNLSSGSFLFSLERLLKESMCAPGDHGVMMTMGPGTTIETALLEWT